MTTLREAAQQALEAFGEIAWSNNSQWQADRAKVAIAALRVRLAQPEQQCAHGIDQKECRWCGPSQQAQEPVAWISHSQNLLSWDKFYDDMTPLYTAPQAQQPLTEEEIQDIGRFAYCKGRTTEKLYQIMWNSQPSASIGWDRQELIAFARAIEAKLKEKNT